MKTIYKYQIPLSDTTHHPIPKVFEPLHVDVQDGLLTLWAEVDPESPKIKMRTTVVGTGHEIPKNAGKYAGTAQMGPFVWHLYIATADNLFKENNNAN